MDGWRLAVLIVIIIVFLIILGIYAILLYLHSQGRLSWAVITSKQQQGAQQIAVGKASDVILYFRDAGTQMLHSIDITHIRDAGDFRQRVATMCGRTHPSSVALSHVDEGNVLVELDLVQFLASPQLSAAARRSAVQPLVLSHHQSVHIPRTPQQSHVSQERDRDPVTNSVLVTPRQAARRLTIAPRPFIFPSFPLMNTNTFIILSAAAYLDPNTGDPLSLTDAEATGLEWGFLRGEANVDLGDGIFAAINAKYHEATIQVSSSISNRVVPTTRRVQRMAIGTIQYAVDAGHNVENSALAWIEYREPFRLPLGRWCVRMQVITDDQRVVESISRVFTVEAVQ